MSPAQVEEYLWEAAVPETSLMLHVLLRGITGHDAYRPRIFELWRRASGQPDPTPTVPIPAVPESAAPEPVVPEPTGTVPEHTDCPHATPIMELAVQAATYLGAAGIGGIIGNRADSAVVRTTTRLFQSVQDRWRNRGAGTDAPLNEEEAVDIAIAAAIALEYGLEALRVTGTDQRPDGSWSVTLAAPDVALRALVPAGDPAEATILIIPT